MFDMWTIFYLLLTVLMLTLVFSTHEVSLRWSALVIAGSCIISNVSTFSTLGDGVYYPLMDALLGTLFCARWGVEKTWWLGALAGLFVAMMGAHAVYFRMAAFTTREYEETLNALYASQLAVLSWQAVTLLRRRAVA